jgi:DNA polymerase elongation subunit (family B)
MIVNKEIRKSWDMSQNKECNQLVISYVGSDHHIKFMTYNIPDYEMFEWDYAKQKNQIVSGYMSYDGKPVKRVPKKNTISKERIYQILFDLNKNNQINAIFDNYIPETYFWDIENDIDENGFTDPNIASMPITVMSWVKYPDVIVFSTKELPLDKLNKIQENIYKHCEKFKDSPKYNFIYKVYNSEYEMLYDFAINHYRTADAITGWNIWGYDLPYFNNRCERLGIDLRTLICPTGQFASVKNDNGDIIKYPKHKLVYDYLQCFKKWDRTVKVKESFKLDFIGEAVCGVKKVQHKLSLKEMWEQTPDDYVFYNAIDSILVEQIDKKAKTSSAMYGLANLTRADIIDVFGTIASVEIVQNEYLYRENKVIPQSVKKNEFREYEGAFVFKPDSGIHKWVLGLDYASLYPSTQRQFNISPETFMFKDKNYQPKNNEIKCASGSVFTKEFDGFIPKILTHFYNERKRHKKEMKTADSIVKSLEEIYNQRIKNQ